MMSDGTRIIVFLDLLRQKSGEKEWVYAEDISDILAIPIDTVNSECCRLADCGVLNGIFGMPDKNEMKYCLEIWMGKKDLEKNQK